MTSHHTAFEDMGNAPAVCATASNALAPTEALAGLRALYPPPHWVRGATQLADAEFLFALVQATRPVHVVEFGVAAGTSSAVLLYALDTLPLVPGGRSLRSCDVESTCYFDRARAIGDAARMMYPAPRATWLVDGDLDSRRLSQQLPPASVDLTFIDANHAHPWPLLDLLHATAFARPQSWVVLHDINLPTICANQGSGAKRLYDVWPGEKMAGTYNIGAVRLPADLATLVAVADELLQCDWEFPPTPWHVALPAPFTALDAALQSRMR